MPTFPVESRRPSISLPVDPGPRRRCVAWRLLLVWPALLLSAAAQSFVELDPPNTVVGYVATLLINEVPFPGEKGYVSEQDTQAAMRQILWVLHCRLWMIPQGYRQEHVAGIRTSNVIDIITGGGGRQQCAGFYLTPQGQFTVEPRVLERIRYLMGIANRGSGPGRFCRLLTYGRNMSRSYLAQRTIEEAARFATLYLVQQIAVTGRAYSWMTDKDYYRPGGNFVTIPDAEDGSLGGNRFFTLRKAPK